MKLLIYIITLTLVETSILHAQNIESKGVVNYGHKLSMGLGAPIGIDFNANLTFNSYKSAYVYKKDSLEGDHIYTHKKIVNNKHVYIRTKSTNKRGFIFSYNLRNSEAKHRDIGFSYVSEKIPKIDWRITSETKTIGKFTCIKAKGHFRGRDYTAWYTMSIPVPFGPWKLQGLPGLILEAYDTHKEVYFYFKSIDYPSSKKAYITEPNPEWDNKEWISYDDFKTIVLKRFKRDIESARLIRQQSNVPTIDTYDKVTLKSKMKKAYIEDFSNDK